jgi:hypothetical protein
MSAMIFYLWGFYFFIFSRRMQTPPIQFNATLLNWLKGFGLMVCGKLVTVWLHSLSHAGMDIDINKVDGIIGVPLFLVSVAIVARLLNANKKTLPEDKK